MKIITYILLLIAGCGCSSCVGSRPAHGWPVTQAATATRYTVTVLVNGGHRGLRDDIINRVREAFEQFNVLHLDWSDTTAQTTFITGEVTIPGSAVQELYRRLMSLPAVANVTIEKK